MGKILITHIKQLAGILPKDKLLLRGSEMSNIGRIEDAWLLIKDDRIADFGSMESVIEADGNTKVIDASGRFVIPAFVDSHTHLVFAGTREDEFEMRLNGLSYEEIAARGGGILNSAAKLAGASEDELFETAKSRLDDLISMGTGAIEIKSGYGLSVESELKMLRVIKRLAHETDVTVKSTFLALHAIPAKYKADPDAFVDLMINEALPIVAEENLADYIDVFCEKGYFNIEQTERILEAAANFGLKPKIHVNQFYAFGGVAAAINHGAISVDHLEVMNDEDIDALANSSTIATLLPLCSLFINIPYGPGKELIKHNIPIALATDYNPGSAPSGNMQLVQSLACVNMKLTPIEALNASTINGAAALELGSKLGSITKGKQANILITKQIPSLGYIAYNFGHNHVEKVILNGRLQG